MIAELLDRATRRADAADVVVKTDETVTIAFEAGRLKTTTYAQERGANLRVISRGHMGFAGSTSDDVNAIVDAAFDSARVGEKVSLELPPPAALSPVITHYPRAAAASIADLAALGQFIVSRLTQDGAQVSVSVEKSIGSVRVANSAGADATYDVSTVSVSAEVTRVLGDDVLIVSEYRAAADFPGNTELEYMVQNVTQRIAWAGQTAHVASGTLPVCFTPAGSSVLLAPLKLALLGKSAVQGVSPLADKRSTPVFDNAFTLVDDPLLDGRSGSRPVDDEGVPSRRLPLIEQGRVTNFIYDLETAGRASTKPTGHGRRTTFGKPQAAYSNLTVAAGTLAFHELLSQIQDGLLVDELLGVGQGNTMGGAFSHPVALAYRVVNGEVVGRVKDVVIAGVVYDLLKRIAGIGSDVKWIGSVGVPAMVLEGVSVNGKR
ncbi:MAG: TldD/PmbA family protein [Gemmatimonadota bacterium]